MRSALVLAMSLALALGACGAPDRSSLTPFGGGWYFHRRSHLPEAGWVPTDLYRDWKGRPVLVARNIEQQQFYAPDCVIFVTGHADPPYITYAACGDRRPVAIDVRDYRHWKLEPEGLRYETTLRSAEGVPVRWTETIALDRIKAVAALQPPYDPGWRPGGRFTKAALRPVEGDVPVAGGAAAGRAAPDARPPLVEAAAGAAGTDEARRQRLQLVDALISRGEPVDAADRYGYTPLMMAATDGDVELVQRLIDAGASVNARAGDGRTVLMIGAETLGDRIGTVRALISAGADRTLRDNDGQTAADRMLSSQDAELRSLLE